MFSRNRHRQEKPHWAAFISRGSSKPRKNRPSAWKICAKGKIHRCRFAQQSFAFHCSVLGLALKSVLNLNGYMSAFWYFLAFGEGLGLFYLLVINLLWWRNTKRIRFSFLPEKKYYQNPKKHIESFLRGIPLFAAIAALTALVVTVLWAIRRIRFNEEI